MEVTELLVLEANRFGRKVSGKTVGFPLAPEPAASAAMVERNIVKRMRDLAIVEKK